MIRIFARAAFVVAILSLFAAPQEAQASSRLGDPQLQITVDIASQRMLVGVDGFTLYRWSVATARKGYITPTGVFPALWMARTHHSSKYKVWNERKRRYLPASMNDAIFFADATAIHAGSVRERSHGCIHLAPANARTLFDLVEKYGKRSTVIVVH